MNAPHSRSFADATPRPFARKLPTRMVEKVWGRDHLPTPFAAPDGQRIGEIWFEPPPELSALLVKYLFTSEKLSVQVHPGDANAQPGEAGKDECWLVLDAELGARLAIGFDDPITPEDMAAAARSGAIERLLTWHEAKPGDVFYLPAGTVHAIGPGLSLVEVQQNSDTTFRLYDYGRPRELHLDRAITVAKGERYDAQYRGTAADRGQTLINASHFRIDRVVGAPDVATRKDFAGPLLALPLDGEVAFQTDAGASNKALDDAAALPGECVFASGIDALDFTASGVSLLVASKA